VKRPAVVIFCLLVCAIYMSPQSVVELAEKEKARRAALRAKARITVVVTNADLKKYEQRVRLNPEDETLVSSVSRDLERSPKVQSPAALSSKFRVTIEEEIPKEGARFDVYQWATKALASSRFVDNPGLAIWAPNGLYAEITLLGFVDLEINAVNETGDDIAIYSRMAGNEEFNSPSEGGIPMDMASYGYDAGGFWFMVLVHSDKNEWIAIGRGTQDKTYATFDLGEISSTSRIRIMFKPHINADLPVKTQSIQPGKSTFGIDAVKSLH